MAGQEYVSDPRYAGMVPHCRELLRLHGYNAKFGVSPDTPLETEMAERFAGVMQRMLHEVFDYRDAHGELGLEEGEEPYDNAARGMEELRAWLESQRSTA